MRVPEIVRILLLSKLRVQMIKMRPNQEVKFPHMCNCIGLVYQIIPEEEKGLHFSMYILVHSALAVSYIRNSYK